MVWFKRKAAMDWFYQNREERSSWLATRFSTQISGAKRLLDVGCYNADFKKYIPNKIIYTGIDVDGNPDHFIDLDKVENLPFKDKQFDFVVCADVLEHLENIHGIFDELCRVSRNYILITMPNAYACVPGFLRKKTYTRETQKLKQFGKYSKYYGLPLEKPKDRHRWFFSSDEAINFIKYRCARFDFQIVLAESEYGYQKRTFPEKLFLFLLRMIDKNLADNHIIVLLKKNIRNKNNEQYLNP